MTRGTRTLVKCFWGLSPGREAGVQGLFTGRVQSSPLVLDVWWGSVFLKFCTLWRVKCLPLDKTDLDSGPFPYKWGGRGSFMAYAACGGQWSLCPPPVPHRPSPSGHVGQVTLKLSPWRQFILLHLSSENSGIHVLTDYRGHTLSQ